MFKSKWATLIAAIVLLLLATPAIVTAATLVVDGQFNDWADQPHVDDPVGDGPNPNSDITSFYWGTNPSEDYIYWMAQRAVTSSGNPRAYFFVFLDANNNGTYTDAADRMVQAVYDPQQNSSNVVVTVFSGGGQQISQSSGDWGESVQGGGARCEWRVSFADLGIDARQTISMYAGASPNDQPGNVDRVPDSGSITWTPIPILDYTWLIILVAVVIGVIWYVRGRFVWRRSPSGQ
jgi:hypothetical protein